MSRGNQGNLAKLASIHPWACYRWLVHCQNVWVQLLCYCSTCRSNYFDSNCLGQRGKSHTEPNILDWKVQDEYTNRYAPNLCSFLCVRVSEPQGQNLSNHSVCLSQPLPHIPRNPNPASLLAGIWPKLQDKAHKDARRSWGDFHIKSSLQKLKVLIMGSLQAERLICIWH